MNEAGTNQAGTNQSGAAALDALISAWLAAHDSGDVAQCESLLRSHPELAEFCHDYRQLDRRFAPLRQLSGSSAGRKSSKAPSSAAEVATLGAQDTFTEPVTPEGTLGDYELLGEIARGGMGVVYKARQRSLNRIVALKMVSSEKQRGTDHARFLAEARAVARLSHQHIVPIYEVGELGGQPYFTMEYFSAGSLRERIADLQGDAAGAARLMVTICRAVEHAHRRGILHRDLKPSNILLDERLEPHVTDFGLAKHLEEESDLTQAGAIVGTPSYMAPEQINAQADLTTAADVYGLGALMYELFTGRPPFKRDSPMETMLAALNEPPIALRKLAPALPADLETITLKCLEKDPLVRYGSADAMADDLERWLGGRPIVARAVTTRERLVKWARRQPLVAGSLATALAAFVAMLIAGGFLWQNAELRAQAVEDLDEARGQLAQVDAQKDQAEKDRDRTVQERTQAEKLADEQRKLADEQRQLADKQRAMADQVRAEVAKLQMSVTQAHTELEAAKHEARSTLYTADMLLAHVNLQAANMGTVNELLDKYADPKGAFDLRNFEWHYLWRQAHTAKRSWSLADKGAGGLITAMAISPDGKTVATAFLSGEKQQVSLWLLADGKLIRSFDAPAGIVAGLAFSADGLRIQAAGRGQLDFQKMGKAIEQSLGKKQPLNLAEVNASYKLHSWPVAGGASSSEPFDIRSWPGANHSSVGVYFVSHEGQVIAVMASARSADGKYLALGGMAPMLPGDKPKHGEEIQGGRLLVYNLQENKVTRIERRDSFVTAFSFSTDSKLLAIGLDNGLIELSSPARTPDAADPAAQRQLAGHQDGVTDLRFTPDGKYLVSSSKDMQLRRWDVATGEVVARFRGNTGSVYNVALTPDGETAVSGSVNGDVTVWDLAGTSDIRVLGRHDKYVAAMRFTADGRALLAGDTSGKLTSYELQSGKASEVIAGTSKGVISAALSASSKTFATGSANQIKVYDLSTKQQRTIEWKNRTAFYMALSPDDRLVAAGNLIGGQLGLWSAADGKPLTDQDGKPVELVHGPICPLTMSFSPDGRSLIAAHNQDRGGGVALLWNLEKRDFAKLAEDAGMINNVALSPDGTRWAAAAIGKNVLLGRIGDQHPPLVCRGAGVKVIAMAFTPDGRRLVTAALNSSQAILKLWDTDSGREVFSANLPPVQITAIAVSPDGRRLAAGTTTSDLTRITAGQQDAQVFLWDAEDVDQK